MATIAPQTIGNVRRWGCQSDALLRKTGECVLRRPGPIMCIVIVPTIINFVLSFLKAEIFEIFEEEKLFPESIPLALSMRLPKCIVFGGMELEPKTAPCDPLAITWRDSTYKSFAESLVSVLDVGENAGSIKLYDGVAKVVDYIFDYPGVLDAVLVIESIGPNGLEYSLWKNHTAELECYPREGDYHHYAHTQKAIEEAALTVGLGSPKVSGRSITATLRKLSELKILDSKSKKQRTDYPEVVDSVGGSFIVLGLTIVAVFSMNLVTQEKRDGLLGLLRMTGLFESTYWLSWFIVLMLLYFVVVFVTSLFNLTMNLDMMANVDFSVHLFSAFCFLAATVASMLMFASLVKEPKWIALVQFVVVLYNLLFQLFISIFGRGEEIPKDFWTNKALTNPDFSTAWKIVLFFMPVYHYGKILNDIYTVTGTHGGRSNWHGSTARLIDLPVRKYRFDDMFKSVGYNSSVGFPACFKGLTKAYNYDCSGLHVRCTAWGYDLSSCPDDTAMCTDTCDWYDVHGYRVGSWYSPSVSESHIFLLLDAIIFMLLTWYLAQIFSAGTGSAKPYHFPLMRSFWTGIAHGSVEESPTVKNERELSSAEESCRLWKLSKSYNEVTAVKELSLAMFKDQIFCLLGQNGAGKTSTINVLTGLHPPTFGDAFVCGLTVRTEIPLIQAIMGACPQDNVLFDGLSGRSHLYFWGRFRGMPRSCLQKEADELLAGVALSDAASRPAMSYSGGMKRRLSVAIAYLGSPRIIFLDEPTTGLDPLSRMRTWDSIAKLKQGRVVCLTTHSMEEADCLGDRIGIMASGKMRALGTPLFLKNKFGSGYHITLVCAEGRSNEVIALLKRFLPSADVISDCAGHITVGVEKRLFSLIPGFFNKLESDKAEGNSLVHEWSLCASTLEEVFLKVAVSAHAVNAEIEKAHEEIALSPGLQINAIEGMPVSITLFNSKGQHFKVDHITSQICGPALASECPDFPTLPGVCSTAEETPIETLSVGETIQQTSNKGPETEGINAEGISSPQVDGAITINARPGKLGAGANWNTGVVLSIDPGSQAAKLGIKVGMRFSTINGVAYSESLFDEVVAGTQNYTLQLTQTTEVPTTIDGRPEVGELPPPAAGKRDKARPHSQLRSLLFRYVTLQKKQTWPNCCRISCVIILVLVSMVFMLFIGASDWSVRLQEGNCPAAYRIQDTSYWKNVDKSCNRTQFVDYYLNQFKEGSSNKSRCSDVTQGTPSGKNLAIRWTTAFDNMTAAWEILAWKEDHQKCSKFRYTDQDMLWDPEMEWAEEETEGCRGYVCGTSIFVDKACPDDETSLNTPCARSDHLPNFCAMMANRVEHRGDGFYTSMVEQHGHAAAEALSTLNIWHEGPLDDIWLGGVRNGSTVRQCGSVRVRRMQVQNINSKVLENQRSRKSSAVRSDDLLQRLCCEGEDDWCLYGFEEIGILGEKAHEIPFAENADALSAFEDVAASFPDIGVSLQSHSSGSIEYDVWVYGQDRSLKPRLERWEPKRMPYPFARVAFEDKMIEYDEEHHAKCPVAVASTRPTWPDAVHAVITSFTNGLLKTLWSAAGHPGDAPQINGRVVPMPVISYKAYEAAKVESRGAVSIVCLMLPLVSMLFFPVMVNTIQQEKAERNVLAMQIQSLKLQWYWLAVYLFNYLLYWSGVGTYYFVVGITGQAVFKTVHHGHFFLSCLLWGHSQVAIAIVVGTGMGKSRVTTLISYVIITCTLLGGMVMSNLQWIPNLWPGQWPVIFLLVPPLNFVRSFMIVLNQGKEDMPDLVKEEFTEACCIQFAIGTGLMLCGIFFHTYVVNDVSGGQIISNLFAKKKGGDVVEKPSENTQVQSEDEDVAAEAARVENGQEEEFSVVVKKLFKTYSSGFQAVKGISFGIRKGECFGLLGPNGAGKTTVISMLSGSQSITSGVARVGGFDVRTQMESIYKILGIVPQFDVVWQDLPVYDHLLAFARLKGLSRTEERSFCRQVAEAVGLDGDPLRQPARALSGGMRRRLSLGIALVTNPEVLFLDEPSTGLDPETRQSLWRTVAQITPGRCIILTTHSMEEADALCGRIGIMAHGQLRCLGDPLHLKTKFGKGYQFSISLVDVNGNNDGKSNRTSRDWDSIDKFVRDRISKGASVMPTFKRDNLRTYVLPPEGLQVSSVFKVMGEINFVDYGIQDWSLNQTSLNEVFLRIAEESEGKAVKSGE